MRLAVRSSLILISLPSLSVTGTLVSLLSSSLTILVTVAAFVANRRTNATPFSFVYLTSLQSMPVNCVPSDRSIWSGAKFLSSKPTVPPSW